MPMMEECAAAFSAAAFAELEHAEIKHADPARDLLTGFSSDTRTIEPGNCFLAFQGDNFNGNLYAKTAAEKGAALCVLSQEPAEDPGAPYMVVQDTVRAYGDAARSYLQSCKAKGLRVIAVTGSSGKTTVKDMTAHVLAKQFKTYCTGGNHNNHIGVPFTVLHMPQDTEIAVLEMGMNHTGEISRLTKIALPDLAIVTNIGTAHIGNLGSQEAIFRAKMEIADGMDPQKGKLILPADDAFLANTAALPLSAEQVCYSSRLHNHAASLCAESITETAEDTRFIVTYRGESVQAVLPMTGLHNVTNALLAIHAGLECGMTLAHCAAALSDFVPGEIRSGRVTVGSCTVIRDYYNANPEAMAASLQALGTIAGNAKKIAVLGNMNELGDFAQERHKALGEMCKTAADTAFFCGVNHADFAAGYGSAETAFAEQNDLISALLRYADAFSDEPHVVLIKGSRGLHMEHVYDALLEKLQNQ